MVLLCKVFASIFATGCNMRMWQSCVDTAHCTNTICPYKWYHSEGHDFLVLISDPTPTSSSKRLLLQVYTKPMLYLKTFYGSLEIHF